VECVSVQLHLIKKIIDIGGTSKGIILPKSWIIFHEKKNKQKICKVGMELNGKIVIWPLLKEWEI
jgi:hypothetical protein